MASVGFVYPCVIKSLSRVSMKSLLTHCTGLFLLAVLGMLDPTARPVAACPCINIPARAVRAVKAARREATEARAARAARAPRVVTRKTPNRCGDRPQQRLPSRKNIRCSDSCRPVLFINGRYAVSLATGYQTSASPC